MTSRFLAGGSRASLAPLCVLLFGCIGDDLPSLGDGTSSTGSAVMDTTSTPTSTPTSTEPDDGPPVMSGGGTSSMVDTTASGSASGTQTGPATSADEGTMTGSASGTTMMASASGTTSETTESATSATTDIPEGCGNGVIELGEQCEAGVAVGTTCVAEGFDEGVLGCNEDICAYDLSGCYSIETLQNDNGTCTESFGCANEMGTSGNPQDLLECFIATLTPPFDVEEVEFSFDTDDQPLPDAAELVVYAWAGLMSSPGIVIDSAVLNPAADIVPGLHSVSLGSPITVDTPGFCVGLRGNDPNDGFRLDFAGGESTGESWIRAEDCGIPGFEQIGEKEFPGSFCIRPTVTSSNP